MNANGVWSRPAPAPLGQLGRTDPARLRAAGSSRLRWWPGAAGSGSWRPPSSTSWVALRGNSRTTVLLDAAQQTVCVKNSRNSRTFPGSVWSHHVSYSPIMLWRCVTWDFFGTFELNLTLLLSCLLLMSVALIYPWNNLWIESQGIIESES